MTCRAVGRENVVGVMQRGSRRGGGHPRPHVTGSHPARPGCAPWGAAAPAPGCGAAGWRCSTPRTRRAPRAGAARSGRARGPGCGTAKPCACRTWLAILRVTCSICSCACSRWPVPPAACRLRSDLVTEDMLLRLQLALLTRPTRRRRRVRFPCVSPARGAASPPRRCPPTASDATRRPVPRADDCHVARERTARHRAHARPLPPCHRLLCRTVLEAR